jgi:pSer/pThr/pTyr-binding forkhead associated (FHA) protein
MMGTIPTGAARNAVEIVANPAPNSGEDQPPQFRPFNRQPVSSLVVVDDNSRDGGEVIRIRQSRFVIGREKGHLKLPFDPDMSGMHVELRCSSSNGNYRWHLIDLKSTNGTFLRVNKARLSDKMQLVLGCRRYQLLMPEASDLASESATNATRQFQAVSRELMESLFPRLIELGSRQADATAILLTKPETTIGRENIASDIAIPDDEFLNRIHAKIYRDEHGKWVIKDLKSLNGVWVGVQKVELEQRAEFMVGQQRFIFNPTCP